MKIGIERLISDLTEMGYEVEHLMDSNKMSYGVIKGYEIRSGSFAGRIIDLAIPAPADFPRSFGASIHIKANPLLVGMGAVANIRNVQGSALGDAWQYWSYSFKIPPDSKNHTSEFLSKVNEIFKRN